MIIVIIIMGIGAVLMFQGLNEKTGCGCLSVIAVGLLVLVAVLRLVI